MYTITIFKPSVSLDTINMFENCMNVCPLPQEQYSKHKNIMGPIRMRDCIHGWIQRYWGGGLAVGPPLGP